MKERVIQIAEQVFNTKELASAWLNQKNPVLNDKTPLELLETNSGCETIINILYGIEEGNIS